MVHSILLKNLKNYIGLNGFISFHPEKLIQHVIYSCQHHFDFFL